MNLLTHARRTVAGLVPLALAASMVTATPAEATCTVQLVNAPPGRSSECSAYAHGFAVVVATGWVHAEASCGTRVFLNADMRAGNVHVAPTVAGGCQTHLKITAITTASAVGYL